MSEQTDFDPRETIVNQHRVPASSGTDDAHFLVLASGDGQAQRVEVGTDPVEIGRDATATFRLIDGQVSKRHCCVQLIGGTMVVTDLGSTNGTFIDGSRLTGPRDLPVGAVLQVGHLALRHERRGRGEMLREQELAVALLEARAYVEALLPARGDHGSISVDWRYLPSALLGGDTIGCHTLDADRTVIYVIDVCGHGPGAALHSVSLANLLRRRSMPNVDFAQPSQVLSALNADFAAEERGGRAFTSWYGVYNGRTRRLRYGSAGHPPALLLVDGAEAPVQLATADPMAGVVDEWSFTEREVDVVPGSRIVAFSDGVFGFVDRHGVRWGYDDFVRLVAAEMNDAVAPSSLCERLWSGILRDCGSESFDDDFTLIVAATA